MICSQTHASLHTHSLHHAPSTSLLSILLIPPPQHWAVPSSSSASISVASIATDLESDDGETSLNHAPVPAPASTPASKGLSRTASSFLRPSTSLQTPSKNEQLSHGGGVDHEMLANLRFLLACANDAYRVSTLHVDSIVCMEHSLDTNHHDKHSDGSGGCVAHEVARSVTDAFQAVTEAALKSVVRVVFAPLVQPVMIDFETQWTEVRLHTVAAA